MRNKDGTKRPGNVANLRPIQPGQCLNPRGHNQYTNPEKPFTSAMRELALEPLPEHLRAFLNIDVRRELFRTLRRFGVRREEIPELVLAP